jgi:hypothetical protein
MGPLRAVDLGVMPINTIAVTISPKRSEKLDLGASWRILRPSSQ